MRTALNIQPTIIHDKLPAVFGDEAPAFSTVAKWSKLFREGREHIEDEERPEKPITEPTSENIEQVRSIINPLTGGGTYMPHFLLFTIIEIL